MILQVHTEKELIELVDSLKKEVNQLRSQSNQSIKQHSNLTKDDVLDLIKNNITLGYINKLYGK
tara:strand:- start:505 stop:696 length:192 start_codon:yes stop_codon:yes gene_type:complete